MARRIDFPQEDRQLVRDILNRLDVSQISLVDMVNAGHAPSNTEVVSRSWLSAALRVVSNNASEGKDGGGKVDSDILRAVLGTLANKISQATENGFYREDQRVADLSRLSKYNPAILEHMHGSAKAGDIVRPETKDYVQRDESTVLLNILTGLPASALITGPVQSGISSLLAQLAKRAQEVGLQTVYFDPIPMEAVRHFEGQSKEDRLQKFIEFLVESLFEFDMDPPIVEIDTLARLVQWLQRSHRLSSNTPRVLILDNIGRFGADVFEEISTYFIRPIHNRRATGGTQLFIIAGCCHQYTQNFSLRIIDMSSIVSWQPRIELGWFSRSQVEGLQDCSRVLRNSNLYELFNGQPFLTHAAIQDESFASVVEKWVNMPNIENAEQVRKEKIYQVHRNAIRNSIVGTHRSPPVFQKKMLQEWAGRHVTIHDAEMFLEKSRLWLNKNYGISIYELIATDLLIEAEGVK